MCVVGESDPEEAKDEMKFNVTVADAASHLKKKKARGKMFPAWRLSAETPSTCVDTSKESDGHRPPKLQEITVHRRYYVTALAVFLFS